MTRIHGFEREDVAEKGAVRFGVFAVDDHMSARNHLPSKGDYRISVTLDDGPV